MRISGTEGYAGINEFIQEFNQQRESAIEKNTIEQLLDLLKKFGSNGLNSVEEIKMEIASLLPVNDEDQKIDFHTTDMDNLDRVFDHGCDIVVKMFNEEFEQSFSQ